LLVLDHIPAMMQPTGERRGVWDDFVAAS
jgi:hypothetical protein